MVPEQYYWALVLILLGFGVIVLLKKYFFDKPIPYPNLLTEDLKEKVGTV